MIVPSHSTDPEKHDCPSLEILQRFLKLSLPTAEIKEVGRHVQACTTCQNRLDEFTHSYLNPKLLALPCSVNDETIGRMVIDLCQNFGVSNPLPFESPMIRFEKPIDDDALGTLKHYSVVRELGSGATATVYEAVDTRNGDRVAIKWIRSVDAATIQRVKREAEAISQIRHECIVSLRSVDVSGDGRMYLVLPLVEGIPLSQLILGPDSFTFDRVAEITAKIADALAYVHEIGLLHRDVKPSNILLDKSGLPKLTDFGAVTFLDGESSLTESNVAVGTPCYMSPEQANALGNIDSRTDVYSLGATLYECLTKVKPFRGSTADVIRQVLRVDLIPPRRIDPCIPVELEVICLKALSKERSHRYKTIKEMANDLRRWRANRPISAKPLNRIQRTWITVRRNPVVSFLIASLFLSIATGIIGILWNWRNAIDQRDLALESLKNNRLAINQFYLKIGRNSSRLDQPGLQPLRQELLNEAVVFYREFLRKWPDDPMLEVEMANALSSLAEITESLGNAEETIAAWREAETAQKAILRKNATDPEQRIRLYQCQFHLANGLTSSNRLDEAIATYRDVQALLERFLKSDPHEIRYLRDLASCTGSLGNCLLRMDKPSEAALHYRQACEVFRSLQAEDPSNPDIQAKLAMTLTNLGLCLEAEEQLETFAEARELLEKSYEVRPTALDARRLAKLDLHSGITMSTMRRKADAVAHWSKRITLLKPHVDANPEVIDLRDVLGQLYFNLGNNIESPSDGLQTLLLARIEQEAICKANPDSEYHRKQLSDTIKAIELRSK